jgi:hypothetical protein
LDTVLGFNDEVVEECNAWEENSEEDLEIEVLEEYNVLDFSDKCDNDINYVDKECSFNKKIMEN